MRFRKINSYAALRAQAAIPDGNPLKAERFVPHYLRESLQQAVSNSKPIPDRFNATGQNFFERTKLGAIVETAFCSSHDSYSRKRCFERGSEPRSLRIKCRFVPAGYIQIEKRRTKWIPMN